MQDGSGPSALVGLAAALCGCSLSAGGIVTRPAGGRPLSVGAPSIEGQLQLPAQYRAIAGIEWTRENTALDLHRLGLLAGYSSPPARNRLLGWEATARGGLLRSWTGTTTSSGGFAGARLAALVRLGSRREAWEGDSLVELTPLLVLDLGADALMPRGRDAEMEIAARALLRIHFSSTLIP